MNPKGFSLLVSACLGFATGASSLHAQNLAKNSPFLPPDGQATAAAPVTENAPIEFRGVLVIGGRQQFNFFDPSKRHSVWVSLNDSASPFLVKTYDEAADRVSVEYGGRVLTLTLEKAKINASPITQLPPTPNAAQIGNGGPVPNPPAVLNPTPADEARRLESIAAEVRRRRALRQQQAGGPQPQQANGSRAPGTGPGGR